MEKNASHCLRKPRKIQLTLHSAWTAECRRSPEPTPPQHWQELHERSTAQKQEKQGKRTTATSPWLQPSLVRWHPDAAYEISDTTSATPLITTVTMKDPCAESEVRDTQQASKTGILTSLQRRPLYFIFSVYRDSRTARWLAIGSKHVRDSVLTPWSSDGVQRPPCALGLLMIALSSNRRPDARVEWNVLPGRIPILFMAESRGRMSLDGRVKEAPHATVG